MIRRCVVVWFAAIVFIRIPVVNVLSEVPMQFTIQGRLTDDAGQPVQSPQDVDVYLIAGGTAMTGGMTIHVETLSGVIPGANGVFSHALGSDTNNPLTLTDLVSGAEPKYLELHVGGKVLKPRQQIVAVPFAFAAKTVVGEDLYVDPNSGHVGIGTTMANKELTVAGDADLAGTITAAAFVGDGSTLTNVGAASIVSNTFWNTSGNTGTSPGTHFLGTTDNQPLEFRVNDQRLVGLGPGPFVNVEGIVSLPVASAVDNNSPGITAVPGDDFLYEGEYLNHYGLGWHTYGPLSGGNAYLSGFFGVDLFTHGENRLRIDQDGFIGIGTTNPLQNVHIVGAGGPPPSAHDRQELRVTSTDPTDVAAVTVEGTGGGILSLFQFSDQVPGMSGGVSKANLAGLSYSASTGALGGVMIQAGVSPIMFATGSETANERMRVTTSGVGIGTTNPMSALDVNGVVRADGYGKKTILYEFVGGSAAASYEYTIDTGTSNAGILTIIANGGGNTRNHLKMYVVAAAFDDASLVEVGNVTNKVFGSYIGNVDATNSVGHIHTFTIHTDPAFRAELGVLSANYINLQR
jgi:hypothetical protein